jgi:hypothetical protein
MPRKLSLADTLLCCWILAAQIWYYAQFRELLRGFAGHFLRGLWR